METPEPPLPRTTDVPSAPVAETDAAPDATAALPPTQPTPQRTALLRRLDLLLAGSVLLLAFFVSSFIARNSDFWLHLAGGRLLAQGEFAFGADPFAFTTEHVYWVHHAWLFDLVLFNLYERIGGAGLVLLKALLITALAGLLLRIRRPDSNGWLPAAFTTLAVLVMSPGLQLQPACVSLFFLGLVFTLLLRQDARSPRLQYASVLLVIALWVNVDGWFLLGPLLIALFWLGDRCSTTATTIPSLRTPAWLLPAALAVCLLNPHHGYVFSPTTVFASIPVITELSRDVRFHGQFDSPWQLGSLWTSVNVAAWAYFVLTALGLISFALNRPQRLGWRVLVFGAFCLLGVWQMRAVPFFAVVAAPITTLNLQDFLSRRSDAFVVGHRRGAVLGRLGLLAMNLLLILLAGPGWLHGFHSDARRVSWAVQADPSLQRVAETIQRWRQQGQLRNNERGFALNTDVAHYCAWFCPEEKQFFDRRFALFGGVVHDYEEVCRALNPAPGEKEPIATERWQQVLRAWNINYLVVDDVDTVDRLARDPKHWALLDMEGRASLFAWREQGGCPRAVAVAPFDANRLAFGTAAELLPAPDRGALRDPQRADLWTRYLTGTQSSAIESEAAGLYLRYFRAGVLPPHRQRQTAGWAAYAAGMTGTPLPSVGAWPLLVRLQNPALFLGDIDRDLPALPLLTIRLARRAVAANPEDAAAYLRLAQAYLALHHLTEMPIGGKPFPLLAELRQAQIANTLQQVLILDPDQETAHELLANLYTERGYLDLALHHRRQELRLARGSDRRRHTAASEREQRLERLAHLVSSLDAIVQNRRMTWTIASRNASAPDPVVDAESALRLGLAGTALDEVLLPAPQALLGAKGVRLEFLLELQLGRAEQIRGLLLADDTAKNKSNLGYLELRSPNATPGFHMLACDWLILMMAAATGDYDLAERQLQEMDEQLRLQRQRSFKLMQQRAAWALASECGLAAAPPYLPGGIMPRPERQEALQFLALTQFLEGELADLKVVGGMLELEHGRLEKAATYFKQALERPSATGGGSDFAGRALAEAYRQRLRDARRR